MSLHVQSYDGGFGLCPGLEPHGEISTVLLRISIYGGALEFAALQCYTQLQELMRFCTNCPAYSHVYFLTMRSKVCIDHGNFGVEFVCLL